MKGSNTNFHNYLFILFWTTWSGVHTWKEDNGIRYLDCKSSCCLYKGLRFRNTRCQILKCLYNRGICYIPISVLFQNRIKFNTWTHSGIYRSLYFSGQKLVMTNQLFPSKNELFAYPIKNDQSNPVIIEEVVVLFQHQIYSKILVLFSLEAFFKLTHKTQFTLKNSSISWNCPIYGEFPKTSKHIFT